MRTKLTQAEEDLFAILDGKGDVPISEVHAAYYGRGHKRSRFGTIRQQQMALAWVQGRLNAKLSGRRVQPGRMKQTLCIADI